MNRQVINNHRILNRPNSINNVTEEDNNNIGEALVKDEPVWDSNDNYSSSLKRRVVVENDPKQNRKESSSSVKYIIRSNPTNSSYQLVEPSRVVVTQSSRQTPNLSLPIQQSNRTRNDMNLIEEMIGRKNPVEIKSRLHGLFAQIEKEVDSLCDDYNRLYEENARLKAQINSSASSSMFIDHQNEYLIKISSF